jgi:hypothetical protein
MVRGFALAGGEFRYGTASMYMGKREQIGLPAYKSQARCYMATNLDNSGRFFRDFSRFVVMPRRKLGPKDHDKLLVLAALFVIVMKLPGTGKSPPQCEQGASYFFSK